MNRWVIVDGDKLTFSPQFGERTVTPTITPVIRGSGQMQITHKNSCILGDEKRVRIPATYITASRPISGQGYITLTRLAPDQQAQFALSTTPIIVQGSQFIASFQPSVPASHPKDGPDPNLGALEGTGLFQPSQRFVTAG